MAIQRDSDETRRRALAAFLRKKREALAPTRGPSHQRRLTPGLRREEVASLAGVGTTWYTWLEQARNIRPSERTLRRIARALKLSEAEKTYLLDLGLEHAPRLTRDRQVARQVLRITKAMSTPAFVLDLSGKLLAYNVPANALLDLDYVPEPNLFLHLFTPESRMFLVNWSDYAFHVVGLFRRISARWLGDPVVAEVVGELSLRSREFTRWWTEHEVSEMRPGRLVCDHPFVGRLEFDELCMGVVEQPELVIICLVTEHQETGQRLAELIREFQRGERDASHNLWAALTAK